MTTMRKARLLLAAIIPFTAAALHQPAAGQTNTENFAQFRFNFNNPGARAAGLGGAFISIADDATAAASNPAGLTTIIRPEFSFETKGIAFKRKIDNFSQTGTQANLALESREFTNTVVSPSFASVVVPLRKFTVSAFRQELVNFESSFYTKGTFLPADATGLSFFPVKSDTKLKIINYGAAVAYKVSPSLSVGVGGGLSTISMQSTLNRYNLEVFNEGSLANSATIDDSGTDFFLNAGILFRPTAKLAIGVVYKRQPSFTLNHTFRFAHFPADSSTTKKINFNVPWSVGVGVSYRPMDELTIAFDAVRIAYSRLATNFVTTISEEFVTAGDFTVDDGFEIHGGAEYVLFIGSLPVVLRGGAYLEPDNRIRWAGGNVTGPANDAKTNARKFMAGLFSSGSSYVHGTYGFGVVLSNSVQFDAAGSISSVSNEVIGSIVVRF
jgi:long-chain fatty acid transport protein